METHRIRVDLTGAVFVFLVTQVVYLLTLTLTCPFWDSGEFIATSYILGIPHPPGTPLYVLIGRIFSLLPFGDVATRINYLSALAASMTAVFTYLFTVELYRRWFAAPSDSNPGPSRWIAFVAGSVAAFFTAFGRTFWENALEAEVYSLSSLIMALSFWLILRWAREGGDRSRRTGLFLLLYYLICLSMGIHLGVFLVLPGIVLFALLVDRRIFGVNLIPALMLAGILVILHPGMLPTLKFTVWVPLLAGVILVSILFARSWPAAGTRGILTWCANAAVLGISTHLYLVIRAGLDPGINEADPRTWDALWKVLVRDQYKPPNPFTIRQAPFSIQITRHFWDYARDQYQTILRPEWLGLFLPYLLGVIGAVGQATREKKSFLLMFVTYLITSLGLVFYLNFRSSEVRDRDYFFVASFHFFAVWIGLGAAVLLEELRVWSRDRAPMTGRSLIAAVGIVAILLPGGTLANFWFVRDRTEFAVARDFARNILVPLEKDAIIFTNGDNDTFPLWYLQEVEKIRTDVRVVNLSLLNTDWYIRQLRDRPPKIDLGWDDRAIEGIAYFSGYMAAYEVGQVSREVIEQLIDRLQIRPYVRSLDLPLMTKDVAVARIVEREGDKRPIYLALTVPDHMGLDSRLVQQGIVMQLQEPRGKAMRVDLEMTRDLLLEVYDYGGVLNEDGKLDTTVYKDINSTRLIQNYAASALSAAQDFLSAGRTDEAMELAEFAREISPQAGAVHYSMGILQLRRGRYAEAEAEFRWMVDNNQADALILGLLGDALVAQQKLGEAERAYRYALTAHPEDWETYRALFSLLWREIGDREGAVDVLDVWLSRHPEDTDVLRARQRYADSLRSGTIPPPGPGISP